MLRVEVLIVLTLCAVPLLGAAGYMMIENWNFVDSLYMSVITITTVGSEVVHPLSRAGKIFQICYLIFGLGVFFVCVVEEGEIIVRAVMRDRVGRKRMDRAINAMKDHHIICGYGRMGQELCAQLTARRHPFVIIDRDEVVLQQAADQGWLYVVGDATDDRTLQAAGIERARGLAAVMSDDADNLYLVLSARLLSKDLQIVARASDDASLRKIEKAGANRVISVYGASANKAAQFLANTDLESFVEIFSSEGNELDLAEILVAADGPYAGLTLAELEFRDMGVLIVGIRRASGKLDLPPSSQARVEPNDRLIALGSTPAIEKLLAR
ncbi:MAG: potassium channel protein [Pirellulales bacterium]|nr:potassium channel protein [Planctomycetales bacterium]